MLITLLFVLSLLALGASVIVFCRFFTNRFRQHPSWPFQPAYIVGMGLFFLLSWLILMPVYAYNTDLNKWQSIVTAFTSALQEFTISLGALLSLLKDYFAKIRMGRSPRIMIGTLIKYVSLFPIGKYLIYKTASANNPRKLLV